MILRAVNTTSTVGIKQNSTYDVRVLRSTGLDSTALHCTVLCTPISMFMPSVTRWVHSECASHLPPVQRGSPYLPKDVLHEAVDCEIPPREDLGKLSEYCVSKLL